MAQTAPTRRRTRATGQVVAADPQVDYPHADSTFPHSKKVLGDICTQAGLNEEETYKFTRGNAIRAFGLERFGILR